MVRGGDRRKGPGDSGSCPVRPLLDAGAVDPIHVYVLIRDVIDAARSRVDRGMVWDPVTGVESHGTQDQQEEQVRAQAANLYAGLGVLLETLAMHEIPYTTVLFPRLVLDGKYFAASFSELLDHLDRGKVLAVHGEIADPREVHYGMAC